MARHTGLAAAVVAVGVGLSYALPSSRLFGFSQFVAYLAAVAGLTVLIGLSGQLSIGHAGLMAVGGYAMALTQNLLYDQGFTVAPAPGTSRVFAAVAEPTAAPWTLPISLLAGVLAALAVGGVLALATAALRGPYLAGLTLAFGLVVVPASAVISPLRGEQGLRVRVPRMPDGLGPAVGETRWRAWVALVATAVVLLLLANLVRGRLGRNLRAVRDDEVAAALCGIPVARTRVLAFVVSAGTAGMAGGVYVYLTSTVLPGYFGLSLSLFLLVAVVLGGSGGLAGAAWGTLFIVAVPIATTEVVGGLHVGPVLAARLAGNLPLALLGLALVVVALARLRDHAAVRRFVGRRRGEVSEARDDTGSARPAHGIRQ
ncbi:MAG TPA: branched-chain amino acid ABC transporter permease [Micromonosporaceae bacterium]